MSGKVQWVESNQQYRVYSAGGYRFLYDYKHTVTVEGEGVSFEIPGFPEEIELRIAAWLKDRGLPIRQIDGG